jgi:hypothetical protein
LLSLNKPPQAERPELARAESSVLHFIQPRIRGCQIISTILGAFGWWIPTLKAFNTVKSKIEDPITF